MKIRKKITLWISGTALFSTLLFSAFVFFELMEEPFRYIDRELQYMADTLVEQMKIQGTGNGVYDLSHMPYNPDNYWIKVIETNGNILYQSEITRYADIPRSLKKTTYMVERTIPGSQVWLGQDDSDDVLFRVRQVKKEMNNLPVEVRIAKPIETLEEELLKLARRIAVSLTLCTLVILILSYKLAGKILNPMVSITRMSKEISEKSLYKRIPLGRNRDELYDLSLSLNKMFDRLHYSFERQKEFIGNASHELKSPITLLMLAQEEMLMNDDLLPAASKGLNRQLDTTRRMSHLVRNLLDLSRLEQQESLVRESIDLTELVSRVVDDYGELFEAKNVSVQNNIVPALMLQGDREKLFRLFVNLIDNSIRYNIEKNGRVVVEGKKTNQGIWLEISNTGQVIPENDLDRIFEQFYRVEKSRSLTHGGSGLGLAIAKKIVELHDGSLHVTNEPGNLIKAAVFFPLKA